MDSDWVERAAARCSDPVIVYRVMMKQLAHRLDQLKLENDALRAEVRVLRVQHQREVDSRLATSPRKGSRRCLSATGGKRHSSSHDVSSDRLNNTSSLPSQLTSPSKLMHQSALATPKRAVQEIAALRRDVSTAGTNTSPLATPRPHQDLPKPTPQLFDMMVQTTPRHLTDSAIGATGDAYPGLVTSTHHVQTDVTPPHHVADEERPAMCLPNSSTTVVLTTLLRHLLLLIMQDDRVVAARGTPAALPRQIDVGGKEVTRLLEAVIGMVVQLKRRVVAAAADAARHIEAASLKLRDGGVTVGSDGRGSVGVPSAIASPTAPSFDERVPLPSERQLLANGVGRVGDRRADLSRSAPAPPPLPAALQPQTVAPLSVHDLLNSSVHSKSGPDSNTIFSTLCGDREMLEYEQWREDFSKRVQATSSATVDAS